MKYYPYVTIYDRRLYFTLKYFSPILNKYLKQNNFKKYIEIYYKYILPRLNEFLDNIKINDTNSKIKK